MQSIGERLEEARKRKGLSIRDAAEATKIRGDFLTSFESNSMDIPLPEIYRRGFLKSYARFLKLDVDKVITDYEAITRSGAERQTRSRNGESQRSGEYLGRMTMPEYGAPAATVYDESDRVKVPDPNKSYEELEEEEFGEGGIDKGMLIKVGIIAGCSILFLILAVLLVNVMSGGKGDPAVNPELSNPAIVENEPATEDISAVAEDTITIRAIDDVTITVRQVADDERIFSETLTAGDEQTITKRGMVKVFMTERSNVVFIKNGTERTLDKAGPGSVMIE